MSEPSNPSDVPSPLADGDPVTERRRTEISIRLGVLVLLGSILAALGAWEAWRVIFDLD